MPSERVQRKIDALLNDAEEAITRKEWQVVQDRAEAVLALDPANEDALHYRESGRRGGQNASAAPSRTAPTTSVVAPISSDPSSFASGRYTVRKFLGEGGKKKVFLAHDTTLDRDVAFALIKTEGLDDAARTRVIREAQVMGRLGDHPHLMPIHDLGREGDQPFMVIPVMSGGDVEGLIGKAPDHRLPLERVKEIGIAVCRGLEFAHSHGIIHRDLKPGNVWLTADGTPKIGDFGLALPMERTRLTQAGMMVGTVAYMPPEQALGGEITPKADLYSLGCMLYEMVTGRPPFLGDDHVAVIGQHINTPPVAPTWHRHDCPKPLEALVMRLLAKDPGQRPDNAGDVRAALEALDFRQAAPIVPAGQPETEGGRSLESLAGGVFVGRQKETGELRAALEEALSGHGKMVMLVGEPGIGKTRTALELTTYAGLRRCQVLWGRCYESQGAPPYWPWVQAIRSYVRNREPDQLRKEMGSGAAEIAEVVSDVKQRLPDLKAPPPLDSPEQARFRLFDSITAFLKTASSTQPIVLVLDDLHWADKPSLLLLEFIARELTGGRLLIIGTYRDVELSRQHPLAETLGELNREHLFERILLRGLTQDDVGNFIEMTSGIKPPEELVRAVHTQTEGNPLFVTEVVRLLVQEGHLTRERFAAKPGQKTTTWTVRIPEGVREVIGRRLNRLSARCNETLTVAAILGREFTLQQLDAVTEGMTEDMLLQVIEEALAARVIEEMPTAVGRYQFAHALIQETLTNELSLTRRVRLHARIAEALERTHSTDMAAHAAELAFHFEQAQALLGPEKYVQHAVVAGERAIDALAFEDARSYFERVCELLESSSDDLAKARTLFGLSRSLAVLSRRADRQRALDLATRSFDIFMRLGHPESALRVAQSPHTVGGTTGALALAERALPLAEPGSLNEGWLLCRYGVALHTDSGRVEDAMAALSRAVEIAGRHKDIKLEARATTHIVQRLQRDERLEEATREGRRAVDLVIEARDPMTYGRLFSHLIVVHLATGDTVSAEELVTKSMQTAAMSRIAVHASSTLFLQATLRYLQGQWEPAREALERMGGDRERGGQALRCAIDLQTGKLTEARSRIESWISATDVGELAYYFVAASRLCLICHEITGYPSAKQVLDLVDRIETGMDTSRFLRRAGQTVRALAAVTEGRADDAQAFYVELRERQAGLDPWVWVPTGRVLGLLARLLGRTADAEAHFESARIFCERAGYRPELAWTLQDHADFLNDRKQPGDRDRAVKMWGESLAIARELGMKPLVERVIARKKVLGA